MVGITARQNRQGLKTKKLTHRTKTMEIHRKAKFTVGSFGFLVWFCVVVRFCCCKIRILLFAAVDIVKRK